jgi:hypothetical protein
LVFGVILLPADSNQPEQNASAIHPPALCSFRHGHPFRSSADERFAGQVPDESAVRCPMSAVIHCVGSFRTFPVNNLGET